MSKHKKETITTVTVTDESSPQERVRVRRLRMAAAGATLSALALVGCAPDNNNDAAPSSNVADASTTFAGESASPTSSVAAPVHTEASKPALTEAEQMRNEAQIKAREMASQIVDVYNVADASAKGEGAGGDDGSAIQYVETSVGGADFRLQVQRYDPDMPAADVNLEAVSISSFAPDGTQQYDFGISLYDTGDVYAIQSMDAGVSHSINFSETGPVTETGVPATLNDEANILLRAQAMLETAQSGK